MQILPLNGQSNYDISLQGLGNLDNFIKILSNNSIKSSELVSNSEYTIPVEKNINSNLIGLNYATKYQNGSVNGSGVYDDSYGGSYG